MRQQLVGNCYDLRMVVCVMCYVLEEKRELTTREREGYLSVLCSAVQCNSAGTTKGPGHL